MLPISIDVKLIMKVSNTRKEQGSSHLSNNINKSIYCFFFRKPTVNMNESGEF